MKKQTYKHNHGRREEREIERAYSNISSPVKRTAHDSTAYKKTVIIASCIAIVAILVSICAGILYFNGQNNGVILDNVTIAGVDVGGMTRADAISAVSLATTNTYTQTNMVICVLDTTIELTPADSGVSLDVSAAVDAALKYGRTGSLIEKYKQRLTASTKGYALNIIPYLSLNTDTIRSAINTLGLQYSTTLTQSTYEVIGTRPSGADTAKDGDLTLVIQLGTPEYSLDVNLLYDQVLDAYNKNVFYVEGSCAARLPDPLDLTAIYTKHCIAPIDASVDANTYQLIEEKYGYGFVISEVEEQIKNAKYGEKLSVSFTKIAPEITLESLTETMFHDVLGTFTARYKSETDRNVNLRLACEAINGTILYPNDVFSYNDALGERTPERGYKLGPSYAGNSTVYTYGGGICQVSTALYYCTLVADLEIITRDNHGFLPSYANYGMDAVVSWGAIDFMFRNNTNFPIRIEAKADGGVVTVSLVGTDDKNYYVQMDYKILNTYDYSVSYREMSADNAQGYKDGDYIVDPYTGYDVETYKSKYDKQTKALLSKDLVDRSNYRKRDAIICKITTSSVDPSIPSGSGGGITENGSLPDE